MRVLISWIGRSDLGGDLSKNDPGPVLRFLQHKCDFDRICLLNDIQTSMSGQGERSPEAYVEWLVESSSLVRDRIQLYTADQGLHNQLAAVWAFTRDSIKRITAELREADFTLLFSPGFPAAQASMMIASEVLFDPEKVEAWNSTQSLRGGHQGGIERVVLPFVLSIDLIPRIVRRWQQSAAVLEVDPAFGRIKGTSRAIRGAIQQAQRVAGCDLNVLISGERGTGKELLARAIHDASPRRDGPYVELNCAALSETLLESELFGHEKGAFTGATQRRIGKFEQAHRGTLFLDEVGEMSLSMQAKLLRVLDGHGFERVGGNQKVDTDVRIIAATNRDLAIEAAQGKFRDDLYDRLNRYPIRLPSLGDRLGDVAILAGCFLEQANVAFQLKRTFSQEALAQLARYPWPGNVRQLKNVVEQLVLNALGDEIVPEDIAVVIECQRQPNRRCLRDLSSIQFITHLAAVADELIERYTHDGLPVQRSNDTYDIFDEIVQPILYGRALIRGETKAAANKLLAWGGKKASIDMSKTPHKERLARYDEDPDAESRLPEHLRDWINEDEVRRIRGLQT